MYKTSFKSYAGVTLAAAVIASAGVLTAPPGNADSPVFVDPTGYGQQTGQPVGQQSSSPGRTMGAVQAANSGWPGQCTWGALQKAFENVGYYPDIHGNARLWADSARSRGWTVVDEPQARSIAVYPAELPEKLRAAVDSLLAELPDVDAADSADADIDELARRLEQAHELLVTALESVEKG